MKTEDILQLFKDFELAASEIKGVECWSAREIQSLLGYSKWENFEKVIHKAKEACNNSGENIADHFPDVRKMVSIGSDSERSIEDILLTRYSSSFPCPLIKPKNRNIFSNHTSLKPEVSNVCKN